MDTNEQTGNGTDYEAALRQQQLAETKRQQKAVAQQRTKAAGGPKFTGAEFGLWLGVAIVADLLSLIPYVGLIVSYPFMFFFWLFKMMKGLNWKKSTFTVAGTSVAETFLSSLPACIAAVVITYLTDKAQTVTKKVSSGIPVARKISEATT